MKNTNLIIETAKNTDITQIMDILNEVTLKLLDKKIKQWTYPWYIQDIETEIHLKRQYVVKKDAKIIGVFSLKTMKEVSLNMDVDERDYYLYRIAIHPDEQSKGIGIALCKEILHFFEKKGIKLYLDCYAGNEKLKSFYKKSFYYMGDYPEEDYYVSVFTSIKPKN